MDFFAAQAAAKRRTWLLVLLFALAWIGTIAAVDAALLLLLRGAAMTSSAAIAPWPVLLAAAAGVTAVTGLGTAWHAIRLAQGGGEAVARMLGGTPVDRRTQDQAERRFVNVVEEMAIASGIPVPAIYVLAGEPGINAFASGFTPDRAAVAVTRGALDELTREELQGVVAHELSHVLNADSRLDLQLIAAVGGLTVLALAGRVLLRGSPRPGPAPRR